MIPEGTEDNTPGDCEGDFGEEVMDWGETKVVGKFKPDGAIILYFCCNCSGNHDLNTGAGGITLVIAVMDWLVEFDEFEIGFGAI